MATKNMKPRSKKIYREYVALMEDLESISSSDIKRLSSSSRERLTNAIDNQIFKPLLRRPVRSAPRHSHNARRPTITDLLSER